MNLLASYRTVTAANRRRQATTRPGVELAFAVLLAILGTAFLPACSNSGTGTDAPTAEATSTDQAKGEAAAGEDRMRELGYLDPDEGDSSPEVHVNLALGHMQSGDLARAMAEFQAALRLAPEDPAVHAGIASCLARQGRYEEARKSLDVALRLDPDNPMTLTASGFVNLEAGKTDEAKTALDKVLTAQPEFVPALLAMGLCLAREEDWYNARAHFEEALRVDPANPDVLYNLGLVLERLGETGAAIEAYRKVLEYRPGHPKASANLAKLYQEQGESDKAVALLESVVASESEGKERDKATYYNLGTVEMQTAERLVAQIRFLTGRVITRQQELREERAKPDPSEEVIREAEEEVEKGRAAVEELQPRIREHLEKAVEMLKEAIVLDPAFEYAHNNLARSYVLLGDILNGYKSYDRMTKLFPENPEPWYHTAQLLLAGGAEDPERVREAESRLRRAFEAGGSRFLELAKSRPEFRVLDLDALFEESNGKR